MDIAVPLVTCDPATLKWYASSMIFEKNLWPELAYYLTVLRISGKKVWVSAITRDQVFSHSSFIARLLSEGKTDMKHVTDPVPSTLYPEICAGNTSRAFRDKLMRLLNVMPIF
ncbi:hypothetical protein RRG08_030137 [Elysia crispata]|uniref:Uncharacterized protein n=1 Tax=Elysia crispata TaxID=231223 RepID=A0AAE0ZRD7_9GAST|nr:hypothetical protein RRG08_030137 [Elysia crispata]